MHSRAFYEKICKDCIAFDRPVWGILKQCDYLIVGESPGNTEIIEGKPFVGAAGKFLWETLAKLGRDRRDFAIVNAACCMIDKKSLSVAQQKEILAKCRPIVSAFIKKIIKPKHIFALGAIAASQLLGKWVTIKKLRGTRVYSEEWGAYIYFLWHPSFLLRSNSEGNKAIFLKDWEYALMAAEGKISLDSPQIKMPEPLPLFSTTVTLGKVVAVDCEWDDKGNLLVFSLSDGERTYYVTRDHLDLAVTQKKLENIFKKTKRAFVFANRPCDEIILNRYGVPLPERRTTDIFPMANIVDENMHLSLETIVESITQLRDIKQLVRDKKVWELSPEECIKYNALDSYATAIAFHALGNEIKKDLKLYRYYKYFIYPVSDMLARVSMRGIKIDKEKLNANIEFVTQEKEKLERELIELLPLPIKIEYQDDLRLSRRKIIIDTLFTSKGFRLKPDLYTETGEPAVNEKALAKYANHPWVAKYIQWKGLDKLLNTFLKGIEKNLHDDGCLYPTFQIATKTGRVVCFNPNVQQVPRDNTLPYTEKLKELYAPPKGYMFLARDYGQSEFRIMAWLSGEKVIIDELYEGKDPHVMTVSRILGKKPEQVTKEERQLAKGINFGLIYGAQAQTLQEYIEENYGISISLKEAEEFREKFFQIYPNIRRFHNRCAAMIERNGYIRSPLGRIRRLFDPSKPIDQYDLQRCIRQGINFVVQSFSSDMALIAMWLFYKKYRMRKQAFPVFFIHDSIFVASRREVINETMLILKDCMEKEAPAYIEKYFNIKVGYPVVSDGKIGKNWAKMKEISDAYFLNKEDSRDIIITYARILKEEKLKAHGWKSIKEISYAK